MYRIIKTDGTEIALVDSVRFIAVGANGSYVEVKEQDAIGVSIKGTLYALLGKAGLQDAETVIVAKTSTAEVITSQRVIAEIVFVKLAETGERTFILEGQVRELQHDVRDMKKNSN